MCKPNHHGGTVLGHRSSGTCCLRGSLRRGAEQRTARPRGRGAGGEAASNDLHEAMDLPVQ